MNVQRQIARLESLLARIQRNAGKPHLSTRQADASVEAAPSIDAPPESGPPTDRTDLFEQPSVPPVAVAAAAPAELEELDMGDDEIVEIAVDGTLDDEELVAIESPLVEVEVAVVEERRVPLGNELEEPVPESAPRAAAQAAEEADLEPPVKTPPPESGRQVVASPVGITGEQELHDTGIVASLEPDLSGGTISQIAASEPSAAQLGETVELEGADGPPARIELLAAPMNVPVEEYIAPDDLELSLPQKQYGGGYDADLAPPSRASEDLARHRQQTEDTQHPATEPPVSLASPPSMSALEQNAAATVAILPLDTPPGEATQGSPVVVARPALGEVQVTEMRRSAAPELPDTFLALLDASLAIEA